MLACSAGEHVQSYTYRLADTLLTVAGEHRAQGTVNS
jgi:hypothetical protein